ncbi:hypothetical protein [Ornithinimicrobium kibberense]|uniref:hypothetical protein n=1 Tax=Ornithinimicrobium kibberense TaxID=282060 RepID=UPI00362193E8
MPSGAPLQDSWGEVLPNPKPAVSGSGDPSSKSSLVTVSSAGAFGRFSSGCGGKVRSRFMSRP